MNHQLLDYLCQSQATTVRDGRFAGECTAARAATREHSRSLSGSVAHFVRGEATLERPRMRADVAHLAALLTQLDPRARHIEASLGV